MSISNNSLFVINTQPPERLAKWLHYQASLTDKLQDIKGNAELQLIFQNWVKAGWWDRHLLKVQDESIFQREILMKSHGALCWYARSIIPKKCYDLNPFFFDRLKNESIKNLIFGNSKVQRIHWIHYPINNQCIEFYWVKKNIPSITGILWARLTELSFQQKEYFYLVEIMLPELENFIA